MDVAHGLAGCLAGRHGVASASRQLPAAGRRATTHQGALDLGPKRHLERSWQKRHAAQAVAIGLLGLLAGGCAPTRVPPPASLPAPAPEPAVRRVAPAIDEQALDDRFCSGLITVLESWNGAWADMRQGPDGDGRWQARPLDSELADCTVDGVARLSASYVCRPASPGRGDLGSTEAMFHRLEGRIDRCLVRPVWYPRRWAKAPPVQLAGGERQLLWRDQAAWPRPALRLKIEENYQRAGSWTVRFTSYTMR